MNPLKWFKSLWPQQRAQVPLDIAVRNALRVCIQPVQLTEEQFEALYCLIMENEVLAPNHKDAGEIITKFFKENNIHI
jgi:hypothetical protein